MTKEQRLALLELWSELKEILTSLMLKKFKKVVKYSTYNEEQIVNVSGNVPESILLCNIQGLREFRSKSSCLFLQKYLSKGFHKPMGGTPDVVHLIKSASKVCKLDWLKSSLCWQFTIGSIASTRMIIL